MHHRSLGLLFLAFLAAPSSGDSSIPLCVSLILPHETKSEDVLYLVDPHTGEKKSWKDIPGITTEILGRKIPGGIILGAPKGSITKAYVYFTEHVLKIAADNGVSVPKGGIQVILKAYRYYNTNSENSRGSGRDHFIKGYLSMKGSGTNEFYSADQGIFSFLSFRKNGQKNIREIPEHVMIQIFHELGIPTELSGRLILTPEEYQFVYLKHKNIENIAVQEERYLTGGRQSMIEVKELSDQKKLKLIAALYFHNIGHGAINAENLTATGKILDPGHISFGQPIMSGIYRCTVCGDQTGSTYDKMFVGPLDHFYPTQVTDKELIIRGLSIPAYRSNHWNEGSRSYRGRLDTKRTRIFINEFFKNIDLGQKSSLPSLSDQEVLAIDDLLHERLLIIDKKLYEEAEKKNFRNPKRSTLPGPESYIPQLANPYEKIHKYTSELLGESLDSFFHYPVMGMFRPNRVSFSSQYLLQIAALKQFIKPDEYREITEGLEKIVLPSSRDSLISVLKLFENELERRSFTEGDLLKLYRFYLPMNKMNYKMHRAITQLEEIVQEKGFQSIAPVLNDVISDLKKPIVVTPLQFTDVTRRMIEDLSGEALLLKNK